MNERQAYSRPTITQLGKLSDITLTGASQAGGDFQTYTDPLTGVSFNGSVIAPGHGQGGGQGGGPP